MTTEQLIDELKSTDNILPQSILRNTSIEQLARELKDIFEANQIELERNAQFMSNFTELVNYVYVATLNKEPRHRNKNLFSDQLITFLLTPKSVV